MTQSMSVSFETASIPGLGWLAVGLVFVTGVLHVYAGVVEGAPPVAIAGVGFLAAILVYLLNYRRRLLYLVGVVYTGIQIPLWYVIKAGSYTTVGYVDKAVQAALVVLLVVLYWQTQAAGEASDTAPQSEQVT